MQDNPKSPFLVVLVEQFHGNDEDGYHDLKSYATLEDAIKAAREITEEAIRECGSVEQWRGMGDAGLVYDGNKVLVWDGIREYSK